MQLSKNLLLLPALILGLAACSDQQPQDSYADAENGAEKVTTPAMDDHHNEVSIGSVEIDGATVKLAQGHGRMLAGAESHLVIKLPTSDGGATVVRAWIGTSDRSQSFVAKATYAAGHDNYNVHADAPDPLPEGVQWWVEIEKPDGSKAVGNANPILK